MAATKTLNVYLPSGLYEEIEREAGRTGRTKGRVVRERLVHAVSSGPTGDAISDLFGMAKDLPADLSCQKDSVFGSYGADHHR